MTEKDILALIEKDESMMHILRVAESMQLPDWLIGAGFVRNKVWDYLHGYTQSTPPTDIDVIYFDLEKRYDEGELEQKLSQMIPGLKWEATNQVTVHHVNQEAPYTSSYDALSKWPETATAIGVRLTNGVLELIAPLGIEDLVHLIARPTPAFLVSEQKKARVRERITQKRWLEKWPKVQVIMN